MSMIRTVKKDNPFVQIDKNVLEDNTISWEAKGIMSYILSKPNDWTIRKTDLIKKSASGKQKVETALLELMAAGYLNWYQTIEDNGQFGSWVYDVYERPAYNPNLLECKAKAKAKIAAKKNRDKQKNSVKIEKPKAGYPTSEKPTSEKPKAGYPTSEKPTSEKPTSENPPFTNIDNTNIDNTNIDNTNIDNIDEEEEEKNIDNIDNADNAVFEVLKEELHDRAVSDVTINKIIRLMRTRNLDMYRLDDLSAQCKHMCDMIDSKKRIYDFAEYFVNGLEQMTENTIVNIKYQSSKPKLKKPANAFYDWTKDND